MNFSPKSNLDNFTNTLSHDLIRKKELFSSNTYWDVNHYRVGYGSDTITDSNGNVITVRKGMTVTKADAERDLNRRIKNTQSKIIDKVGGNWNSYDENTRAALTSVSYNYGSLPNNVVTAARSGDKKLISSSIMALRGHNGGVNAKRRMEEANLVLGVGSNKLKGSGVQTPTATAVQRGRHPNFNSVIEGQPEATTNYNSNPVYNTQQRLQQPDSNQDPNYIANTRNGLQNVSNTLAGYINEQIMANTSANSDMLYSSSFQSPVQLFNPSLGQTPGEQQV
jgi:GH24 family phage-related lysozyme (muramidase)